VCGYDGEAMVEKDGANEGGRLCGYRGGGGGDSGRGGVNGGVEARVGILVL